MAESQPAELGEVLSGYRLEAVIGRGGMGWVYDATHVHLKRRAAIKVLARQHAIDRSVVSRFIQEARIASGIHHPNIVDVFDFVEQDSPPRVACVMELLDGPTLNEVLDRRRMSFTQAMNATIQLASALEAVHKKGVTHRDLKPSNVIVVAPLDSDFSKTPSVKICDFGIAKSQEAGVDVLTKTGMMLGTPAYMSPEQVAGEPVGPETDLYALAEILAEMLTGKRLYEGTPVDVMRAKLLQAAPEIELPQRIFGRDRLTALLRACLATERSARPTILDFKDALIDLREESRHDTATEDVDDADDARTTAELETTLVPRSDEGVTDPPHHPPHQIGDLLDPPGDTVSDNAPAVDAETELGHDAVVPEGFDQAPNTGFFLNRILEDVVEEGPTMRPPPADTAPDSGPVPVPDPVPDQAPKDKPRIIREARLVPSKSAPPAVPPPIAIIRGTPLRAAARMNRTAIIIAGGVLVAMIGGFMARTLFAERQPASAEVDRANPLDAIISKKRAAVGEVKGTVKEHLDRAAELMKQDRWASYERADAEIISALILDRASVAAMGMYVENTLSWREELIDANERALLASILAHASSTGVSHPSLLRALAMLTSDPRQCLELISGLEEDRARALVLRCRYAAGELVGPIADAAEALSGSERIRAELLAASGRTTQAMKILDKRLKADPKNSAVLRAMAAIERSNGKLDAAGEHLTDALSPDGWGMLARVELGHLLLDVERWNDAANTFAEVVSELELAATVRAAAYVGASRAELGRAHYEEAKKRASGALALGPGEPSVFVARAEAELENRELGEAEEYANRALAIDPQQQGALIVLARAAFEDGRAQEGSKLVDKAIAAEPNDARIAAIAFAARVPQEGKGALSILEALEKRDPGERVWSTRRKLTPSPGAVTWAIDRLRRADAKTEVSGSINAALAILYYGSARPREASAAVERALAAGGAERVALAYQAQLAIEAGDLVRADRAVKELMKRDPASAVAFALARRAKR